MKTFETEKHNIPEGATHYRDEDKSNLFTWFKVGNDIEFWYEAGRKWRGIGSHINCIMDKLVEIPQTNIETPEEKEALDSLDGIPREHLMTMIKQQSETIKELRGKLSDTPHQYEVSKFSGLDKWNNGDDVEAYGKPYKYVGLDPFNDNLCICLANRDDDPQCFSVDEIKKPESPQQREDRERWEAAYDLYCDANKSIDTVVRASFKLFKSDEVQVKFWLAIVDKTNYRKESN